MIELLRSLEDELILMRGHPLSSLLKQSKDFAYEPRVRGQWHESELLRDPARVDGQPEQQQQQ